MSQFVDREDRSKLYVIGYFDVEKVYDFKAKQKTDYDPIFKKVPNNAHSKRYFKLRELNIEYTDDSLENVLFHNGSVPWPTWWDRKAYYAKENSEQLKYQ